MFRTATLALTLLMAASVTAATPRISRSSKHIPNQYVVVLEDSADTVHVAARLAAQHHGTIRATWSTVLHGFSVEMTEADALALTHEPSVVSVEENAILSIAATQSIPDAPIAANAVAPQTWFWGPDRLDQLYGWNARLDHAYSYCTDGTGVRAYVVDTGVLPSHRQFLRTPTPPGGQPNTRVVAWPATLQTALANTPNSPPLGEQCWQASSPNLRPAASHGTAVASIIGGNSAGGDAYGLGVAKNVTIVDARTFGCGGSAALDAVVTTLNWIPSDAGIQPSVVNLSFEVYRNGDPTNSLRTAITNLVTNPANDPARVRYPVIVAAGNDNDNTFWYLPAAASNAITVGGLSRDSDTRWTYSNYGNEVVAYAPAEYVEGASTEVPEAVPILPESQRHWRSQLLNCADQYSGVGNCCTCGTSFATPHVTGLVARYLQTHPNPTRAQVVSAITSGAVAQVLQPGGSYVPVARYIDCP
jgi:subtilisin family serine protease